MKFFFCLSLSLIFFSTKIFSATISGIITDDQNRPLDYATVIIKGTTQGCTANENGKYSITLPAGNYNLIFQYVGYTPVSKTVSVGEENITLNIKLKPQQVELKELTINADDEDPAYKVIRAAIKKKKYYLNQTRLRI